MLLASGVIYASPRPVSEVATLSECESHAAWIASFAKARDAGLELNRLTNFIVLHYAAMTAPTIVMARIAQLVYDSHYSPDTMQGMAYESCIEWAALQ